MITLLVVSDIMTNFLILLSLKEASNSVLLSFPHSSSWWLIFCLRTCHRRDLAWAYMTFMCALVATLMTFTSKSSLVPQVLVVRDFTKNTWMLWSVKLSRWLVRVMHEACEWEEWPSQPHCGTQDETKCLRIWWYSNLSAKKSVKETVLKLEVFFFVMGNLGTFQGTLNPLSCSSIFKALL